MKPEYGTVKLFGYSPGTLYSGVPGPGIGYMPQELALQSDLTIGEMLAFYGRLCLLDEATIAKQTEYLVNLLELPSKDRFIANLSGGQKRRVSLAVTIIHKPRLVILDEPTVGVDPLLCQKIWELLIDLAVKEKMTIVITTHYIEETKRANLVGFMRKGQILAEGNPEKLMQYYDANGLETVFYKLCLNQKQRKTTVQAMPPTRRRSIIRTESTKSFKPSFKRNSDLNLNRQEVSTGNKKKFERQGSFTSSFGEYQQQLQKFKDHDNTSKYSTPVGSPQLERENSDPNNNKKLLQKKNEFEQEKQLEMKLLESQKYKKKPLENISSLPTHLEKFEASYNMNPIMFVRNFSVGLSPGQMIMANILGRIFFFMGSVTMMLASSVNLFQIPIYGR
ncbi:hypothetical protein RND71_043276 [Anisodus tanguticus]|uniref:ABC transporter domain-containing protein n=1 Tax=Anisodus tanguticus TaxID=243964 RepID=A0AAE1QRA5_9SOLA|nr:hypothetical protein RND71_043276 [Anisodus tanguticus]